MYLKDQIITYMGNKRKFIPLIEKILDDVKLELGKDRLILGDGFSGSGIVSRLMKNHASKLFVNDIAGYSYTLNQCYLSNNVNINQLEKVIEKANAYVAKSPVVPLWIQKYWAPLSDTDIKETERVYYTQENAYRIDAYRYYIDNMVSEEYKYYLLGRLIVEASIHTNTSGHFAAYYKKGTKGHYGGKNEIDINRITKSIILTLPLFSENQCDMQISQTDTNEWVKNLPQLDLIYLDPPYNKHPYCTYYFLLDVINNWDMSVEIPDTTRGQEKKWKTSDYNSYTRAKIAFRDLIKNIDAKFILLSYNNGGLIDLDEITQILSKKGKVMKIPVEHKTYNKLKGIANYKRVEDKEDIKEFLWLVDCR
uniref:site-specific DNA-methyltransferase (adenine-specific) n=1 Tax=viral metagenome TaxID=1070528 RepID=A0A6C0KGP6_9ZZZZ